MFNPNFYNFQGNWPTFQNMSIPPPPPPPPYLVPPIEVPSTEKNDADFIKHFESKLSPRKLKSKPALNISSLIEQLKDVLLLLNSLKVEENDLEQNMSSLSDEEWNARMLNIHKLKEEINKAMKSIHETDLVLLKKLVAQRAAKRRRLKRLKAEIKVEKEQMKKDREEKSRKIDDYLQKVKNEMDNAKQEEKAKAIADSVLRDVRRNKQDAKKCLVKLDALIKLRKAKMNTAKGRGEKVSEVEATAFNNNIEKLKLLWNRKLAEYEKEELQRRSQLEGTVEEDCAAQTEEVVKAGLQDWSEQFFGADHPQRDFGGDIDMFVRVRSEWDELVSEDGSPLPVGWVPPQAIQYDPMHLLE